MSASPILDSFGRSNELSIQQTGKPAAAHYITALDVRRLAEEVVVHGGLPPSITKVPLAARTTVVERLIQQHQLVVRGIPVRIAQVEAA